MFLAKNTYEQMIAILFIKKTFSFVYVLFETIVTYRILITEVYKYTTGSYICRLFFFMI